MGYGTGAIMAVPGHDQRDFEFATKYGLPIPRVVAASAEDAGKPFEGEAEAGEGVLVNSDFLDGMEVEAAKAEQDRIEAERRERERLAAEREERNRQLLSSMSGTITQYQTAFGANANCLDESIAMEGSMILEQAQMVVEMEDAAMAADIQMLLDGYTPVWDDAIAACAAGGSAPAPDDAPMEDAPEEAPAEDETAPM